MYDFIYILTAIIYFNSFFFIFKIYGYFILYYMGIFYKYISFCYNTRMYENICIYNYIYNNISIFYIIYYINHDSALGSYI